MKTKRQVNSPTRDLKIVAALRKLDSARRTESLRSRDEIRAWLRETGADSSVIALLAADPVIADYRALAGPPHLTTAYGGVEYTLREYVVGFLDQVRVGALSFDAEGERFLRAVRVSNGLIPVQIRTVVFGFSIAKSVDLPFGRLIPALPTDIVLPKLHGEMPPAGVLEALSEVPAVVADPRRYPWSEEDLARRSAETDDSINAPLDRLMVSLAVSYANPIQEHLSSVGALYIGGAVGRNPLPMGAALANPPPGGYPPLDVDRLERSSKIVARVPNVNPIAVAARRYFMAVSERARAADKLIDLVIAIEALTDRSDLRSQTKRLIELLAGGVLTEEKIREDFNLIKYARNEIVHHGNTPTHAESLAGIGRMYVDLAIQAAVREAVQVSVSADQAAS